LEDVLCVPLLCLEEDDGREVELARGAEGDGGGPVHIGLTSSLPHPKEFSTLTLNIDRSDKNKFTEYCLLNTYLILSRGIASTFHKERRKSKDIEGREVAISAVLADIEMGIGASSEENKNSFFMNHSSAARYEIYKERETVL
jgi:hypothetical protein